jgi:hypothetical protein
MKIITMDLHELLFTLEHKGHKFKVQSSFTGDGRLIFDPDNGWDDLSVNCNQDIESLYEEIDEVIYNAAPEIFEQVKPIKEYDPHE